MSLTLYIFKFVILIYELWMSSCSNEMEKIYFPAIFLCQSQILHCNMNYDTYLFE